MAKLSLPTLQAVWLLGMIVMIAIITSAEAGGDHHGLGWLMVENGEEDEGYGMEWGSVTRRVLATTDFISYGALQRNTVPCSRRGASYYNCKVGAEANPYTRDCSAITRCRS